LFFLGVHCAEYTGARLTNSREVDAVLQLLNESGDQRTSIFRRTVGRTDRNALSQIKELKGDRPKFFLPVSETQKRNRKTIGEKLVWARY